MLNNREYKTRIFYFKLAIITLFTILLARSFYIQIYHSETFERLSRENRTSVIPISAPRGRIYDRDGEILVSNKLAHTVSIIKREAEQTTINELSRILDIPTADIINRINEADSSEIIRLKRNISREELILLEEIRGELPGVLIDQMPIRDYIHEGLASHIFGYLGEISQAELRAATDHNYSARDIVGKTGVEEIYETYLRGTKGRELIEINNLGQKVRTLGLDEPKPGNDLILNIDYELQKRVEKLLEDEIARLKKEVADDDEITIAPRGGAAIVADPNDGSILSLVSTPGYDLSKFLTGMSSEEWNQLNQDPNMPLLNRAISTSAPPGSVFKIITSVAAMNELDIKKEDEFYDRGYYELSGIRFQNWYPGGQGDINLLDSLAWSNNTTFYRLGHQLYQRDDTLLQSYARDFGLGVRSGIDLNNETTGLVPDPDWRRNYFTNREDRIWYPGYTINLSIGQGNLRTSPIQLTNVVNAIANDGKIYKPRLVDQITAGDGTVVKKIEPELLKEVDIPKNSLELIKEGLLGVTTYGTARNAFSDFSIDIAGKTGTAQTGGGRPNHGWFAGFAPADDPEISIVVFMEYGGSSSNTFPIIRGIIKEYFDLEEEELEELEEDDLLPEDYEEMELDVETDIDDTGVEDIDQYVPEVD